LSSSIKSEKGLFAEPVLELDFVDFFKQGPELVAAGAVEPVVGGVVVWGVLEGLPAGEAAEDEVFGVWGEIATPQEERLAMTLEKSGSGFRSWVGFAFRGENQKHNKLVVVFSQYHYIM
jgi:hypothetical protein